MYQNLFAAHPPPNESVHYFETYYVVQFHEIIRLTTCISFWNISRHGIDHAGCTSPAFLRRRFPYPEPVYIGWSSVHWNATGWPSVHWDTTGRPIEYLQGTLEHHWKNLVETAHTGETLIFAAYTGTPLEGLWQPTQAPTHIVKHAE